MCWQAVRCQKGPQALQTTRRNSVVLLGGSKLCLLCVVNHRACNGSLSLTMQHGSHSITAFTQMESRIKFSWTPIHSTRLPAYKADLGHHPVKPARRAGKTSRCLTWHASLLWALISCACQSSSMRPYCPGHFPCACTMRRPQADGLQLAWQRCKARQLGQAPRPKARQRREVGGGVRQLGQPSSSLGRQLDCWR